MHHNKFAVWPRECGVQRALASVVLRKVPRLHDDDCVELQAPGCIGLNHSHLASVLVPKAVHQSQLPSSP